MNRALLISFESYVQKYISDKFYKALNIHYKLCIELKADKQVKKNVFWGPPPIW